MGFKFKQINIFLQALVWAFLFYMPYITNDTVHLSFFVRYLFNLSLLAIFFYVNIHLLIPSLVFKRKVSLYLLIILLIFAIILTLNFLFDISVAEELRAHTRSRHNRSQGYFSRFIPTLFSFLLAFGISSSIKMIVEYLKKQKREQDLEHEKLNSELAFLKSQINPHFLFNTLNNLYGLATIGSPSTGQAILKLSDLMRYMLEETQTGRVPLDREITYINNYIELQKLRIPENVEVSVLMTGDFTACTIEPLLLIPFIENAFKHGVSYNETSFIQIKIELHKNKLTLIVKNSVPSIRSERDSISGIGLKNVIKRLELLYFQQHNLSIKSTEKEYQINLSIDL